MKVETKIVRMVRLCMLAVRVLVRFGGEGKVPCIGPKNTDRRLACTMHKAQKATAIETSSRF